MIENIIPILRVENLSISLEYYNKVLGFATDWSGNDVAGLSRDGWRLYLCEGSQGQSGTWLWIGVEDVDQIFRECQTNGAIIKSEIMNNEWAREFQVEDPDGHVLRIGGEPESNG
jgi:uncharacterized glyoxalase superfamily protein PhnB